MGGPHLLSSTSGRPLLRGSGSQSQPSSIFQSKDEHEIWGSGEHRNRGIRRPRSGRLPFFGFWFRDQNRHHHRKLGRAWHFHGPPPADVSAERRRHRILPLALPEQACFGSLHPASPFGVAP